MGRKNISPQRRKELVEAFSIVLAKHGYEGATMAAVANAAGVAPGLIHHNFSNKNELLLELIETLEKGFNDRIQAQRSRNANALESYLEAALKLDENSDIRSAKCWVGIFAEAIRNPSVFHKVRAFIDAQAKMVASHSTNTLREKDCYSLIAFVIGALVLGTFAPKNTAGFAIDGATKLSGALLKK